MRPLLVLSIPHSGTMFALDLLPGRRGSWPGPFRDGQKYFCHLDDPFRRDAMRHCFTVVPLRCYERIKESWERRGINTDDLLRQWNEIGALQEVFFLPLDIPEREAALERLSNLLDVRLKTNWKPVNSMRPT